MRKIEEWAWPYIAIVSAVGAICAVSFFLLIGTITWVAYVCLALAIYCLYIGIGMIRGR